LANWQIVLEITIQFPARLLVSICVNLTQFGAATVFLLLCAKNISELLNSSVSICLLLIFLALAIWPATLLKSPNDFWQILFGGMFCTVATCP
jgi:vesicular inhibitory amino acid transporter